MAMPKLLALSQIEDMQEVALRTITLEFHTMIATFTPYATSFRDMLRTTGSIITGSTVLHFLMRQPEHWTPGHVDIITPKGQFETVLNHILSESGAKVTKPAAEVETGETLAEKTGTIRQIRVKTDLAKFSISESATMSPFHPIPFLWATHLMNALTYDACICAYPMLTLRNQSLITDKSYATLQREVKRYTSLGFTLFEEAQQVANVKNTCVELLVCPKRERMIGDRHTLVIPVGGKSLQETLTRLAKGRTVCWKLGGGHCRNKLCFIRGHREVNTTYWIYNTVLDM